MSKIKLGNWNKTELVIFLLILTAVTVNAIFIQDSVVALISALCGITYTVLAGKGTPYCYLFGLTGSCFYSLLAYQNALWGNLGLYICYYMPMQVIGFFQWNKNVEAKSGVIKKYRLVKREKEILTLLSISSILVCTYLLYVLHDTHPLLDSITTVMSILGMYLTIKRAIEQWIAWIIVNALSCLMWLKILIQGKNVCSTVIMWAVYLFLAIYFYIIWKKDFNNIPT